MGWMPSPMCFDSGTSSSLVHSCSYWFPASPTRYSYASMNIFRVSNFWDFVQFCKRFFDCLSSACYLYIIPRECKPMPFNPPGVNNSSRPVDLTTNFTFRGSTRHRPPFRSQPTTRPWTRPNPWASESPKRKLRLESCTTATPRVNRTKKVKRLYGLNSTIRRLF